MRIVDGSGMRESALYKPWGETRSLGQITLTSLNFTGQRKEPSLGLLFYNARWLDPYLNRWTSPDTIIPDQYDPQSYDRFSYVRNNPVNRVDPSGHAETCAPEAGQGCGGGLQGVIAGIVLLNRALEKENEQNLKQNLESLNRLSWMIPSTFGLVEGRSFQAGAVVEPVAFGEETLAFNWRSGELSYLETRGAGLYTGSPSLIGGNIYFGVSSYNGSSSNNRLMGPSLAGNASVAVDLFAYGGISKGSSVAITDESTTQLIPELAIDPISGMAITSRQSSINIGGNIAANGLDFGVTGLLEYTKIKWTLQLYPWNW